MPSAKELYEQGLAQRQAEEATQIRREKEQKRVAAEEKQRQREKEQRQKEEEQRQREKQAQEEERMLKQMKIKEELDGLSQSVKGRVKRSEKGMSLTFNRNRYEYSAVDVDVIYDRQQQRAIGISINDGKPLTTPQDLVKELANATLNPKKISTPLYKSSSSGYSGDCAGGC